MALSGSFDTNKYGGHRGLRFSWTGSQSISGNYTDVSWSLKGIGSTGSGYYTSGNFKVVIDGETVYSSSTRRELWDGTLVASGTKRIYHNGDGTRSFSASAEAGIYTIAVNCTGSGSWTLNTIPRYANITSFSVSKRDETSVTYSFSADASCDWARYSLDNANWYDLPNNGVVSGLKANTPYTFYLALRRTDSGLWSYSNGVPQTTYDYPKPTSVNDFTIGDGASVNLYNPLNRNVTLDIISNNNGGVIGTYSGTYAGVVNGEFKTTDAINKQYASIPNSNEGTYYARVTYGSSVKTLGTGKYYTNISNCSPSFSSFNVKDSNDKTVNITGNNQLFIKGYSNLYVTIPSGNKMTTQKSATAKSYGLSCDTLNKSADYSTSDVNVDMGTINNSGTLRVNVRAYDSRNNSALAYKDITVYDYAKPVINASITRLNNFENQTTIKIAGTYTRLTIGNVDKNTVTSVKYRYRETGGTWSSWTSLSTSASEGKFTCSDVILSLDNTKSFEFEIQAVDNLDSITKSATLDIGQAIFFISSNKKTCYINGQEILMYDVVDEW